MYYHMGLLVIAFLTLAVFFSFSKVITLTLKMECKNTLKIYSMSLLTSVFLGGIIFGTILL